MTSVVWDRLDAGIIDDLFEAEPATLDFGDRYQLGDKLGAGGQGAVYRAWDRHLSRPVAIKHLHPCPGLDPLAEVRLIGQLAHPAIPQVYDQGTCPDGSSFVVMQYIDGLPLGRYLAERTPSLPRRLDLFRRLVDAVGHAHGRGIIHRDLKPGNVLVTGSGQPYLLDWGLAATGDPRAVCGSPVFAAPEQLNGQVADRRSDVYAMGVLLYFVLTGRYPYRREVTDFNEFRRTRGGLLTVSLRQREPGLPRYLERICEIAMSAQPGARYADMESLLHDLEAAEQSGAVARDRRRWPRGVRWALAAAVIAAVLATGVALGRTWPAHHPPSSYRQAEGVPAPPGVPTPARRGKPSPVVDLGSDRPWNRLVTWLETRLERAPADAGEREPAADPPPRRVDPEPEPEPPSFLPPPPTSLPEVPAR